MFSKIFNKKVVLVLLAVLFGLILTSLDAGVYAESVATSAGASAAASASVSQSAGNTPSGGCTSGRSWIVWVIVLVIFGGMFLLNFFKRKKAVEDNQQKLDSLKPGTQIKTIGLIDGEILEVYEDSLLIQSGNSTLKIDKRAIWQIIPEPQPVEEVAETVEPTEESTEEPFKEELSEGEAKQEQDDLSDVVVSPIEEETKE